MLIQAVAWWLIKMANEHLFGECTGRYEWLSYSGVNILVVV